MPREKKDKIHGSGGFIDVGDCEHSGLARVRPPRPEKLSEADSVAAKAILVLPEPERPVEARSTKKWGILHANKGKKNKLSTMGFSPELMNEGNPKFVEMIKLANDYRKQRQRELVVAHGFVSAGVGSLLATASLALGASRYLYEDAIRTGNTALLTQASKLATDARQNELSAWELCAREATARRKSASEKVGVPWLEKKDGGKKKPGRPRKDDKLREEIGLLPVDGETYAWTQEQDTSSSISTEKGSETTEVADVSGDTGEPSEA